jgi:hypothetical protein
MMACRYNISNMTISNFEKAGYRSVGQQSQDQHVGYAEKINPKSRELVRGTASVLTTVCMLPIDRLIAKKVVGQGITRETFYTIIKKPFLGAIPRLINTSISSFFTFGGSAAFYGPIQRKYPNSPFLTGALSLAGGTILDRIVTAPLGTLGLRMQTQDKTFLITWHEACRLNSPLRSLYAGTSALLLRDILYLPISIPLAEKFRSSFANNNSSPLTELVRSTLAFVASGTVASIISYPFRYIGLVQKDSLTSISIRQVFIKTCRENGYSGVYRGFGMAIGRIAFFNLLFGATISVGERIAKKHSTIQD